VNKGLLGKAKIPIAILSIILITFFVINFVLPSVAEGSSATIWTTDENGEVKIEFSHDETIYVAGQGFASYSTINIKVFEPDNTERCSGYVTADELDAFDHTQFSCKLNGKDGMYKVTADDGNGITVEYEFSEPQPPVTYTVESYSDNTYTTVKNDFVQGETVYGKGTRSSATNMRLRYRNPSNTVVLTCSYSNSNVVYCDYTLPSDAPTGEWDIQIGICSNNCGSSGSWDWTHGTDHFNVGVAPICGNGVINQGEQCDDGNANSGDCCSSTCQIEPTCSCSGEPSVCKADNPTLSSSCGIDMILVIDSSTSIDSTELAQMKTAFNGFVNAFLPNTPTQIAVVDFDTVANVIQGFTSNVGSLTTAINSVSSGGSTNWDDALFDAGGLLPNRADKPDLIVFASDGNPNRIGPSGTSASESAAVAAAVIRANQIKLDGARIITLGIGNDLNASNLIAISSADAYYSTDFGTLATTLAALANTLCGGTISVKKLVDGQPASGWMFTTSVSGGTSNPISSTTDLGGTGFINPVFTINISGTTATVNVTETLQGGYSFINAICKKNNTSVGTSESGKVTGIVIGKNDAIYCEFNNTHFQCTSNANCTNLNTDCAIGICNATHQCEQQFKSSSTVCRESNGVCDVAENCTGSSATCPANSYQQQGTDCGICAACDGQGSCVADLTQNIDCGLCQKCTAKDTCGYQTSSEDLKNECPSGQCVTGNCNGAGGCGVQPINTPCEADQLFCTIDHCNENGNCVYWKPYDCSANNLSEIARCDNNPDNLLSTFDYAPAFTSRCTEGTSGPICTTGSQSLTFTCADANSTDGGPVIPEANGVRTCSAECDGFGIECQPKFIGDYCYYGGICNTDPTKCLCNYISNQYCPTPGAINNSICYFGTQSCTENGCGLSNQQMSCNDTCDFQTGPKDITGPITLNVVANRTCKKLNVTALVKDCNTIEGAEYFIDDCPDKDTRGTALLATDGTFDETQEEVYKNNVDVSGLSDGSHSLYVRGKDRFGNWGECNGTRFEIDQFPPITSQQNVTPFMACGSNPTVTGLVCDDRNETIITRAEYFIDYFNSPDGQGFAMNPTDGSWDNFCEWVTGTINITSLSEGTHRVKIHGKDNGCNWGKLDYLTPVTFIKDTIAPNSTKSVGQPKLSCQYTNDGERNVEACWFVNSSTQINLTATDYNPGDGEYSGNPAYGGFVKMYYRQRWKLTWEDPWSTWSSWTEYTGPITKTEDSIHELEYYAVDMCGNEETHHYEIDIVDNKPPITTKIVGDPKLSGDGFTWITNHTLITLNCTDQQPHPSDNVTLYARYKVDDGSWVDLTTSNGYVQFTFPEDSVHTLEYYCVDVLGNTEQTHTEVDKVDTVPPMTTKAYGQPLVETDGGYPKWINSSTPINLTAVDGGEVCAVGVNETDYRNTIVDDKYCLDQSLCQEYDGIIDKVFDKSSPYLFNIDEESCHLIEYYSIDNLGNTENVKKQCVFVENTPPVSQKQVGTPNKNVTDSCSSLGQGTFTNGCYYVNQSTPITLTCSEAGPHPTGVATIYYKIDWKNETEDSWTEGSWTEDSSSITFNYQEDSYHRLTWYCVDALGNTEQTHTELDIVDTQPPISIKNIYDPKHACNATEQATYYPSLSDPTDGCYYVNQSTPIEITCSDVQPHPVNNVSIYFRKFLVGATELPLFQQIPYDNVAIHYDDDSAHVLEWYCVDELGNKEVTHTEYDIVDTRAPNITKTIVGPQFYNSTEGNQYIDGVTVIHVESTDPEPHPVDNVTCDWDYTVTDGIKTGSGQTGITPSFDINFPEESTHVLTITCRDALGNTNTDVETFLVDKTPPTTTKTYGAPFYSPDNNATEWINSSTPITLTVDDTGVHKSGINETKYRVTLVDDNYCASQTACQSAEGSGSWTEYSTPFTIHDESCHLIEYYSVDNVDKTEQTKRQCVYVENTPPVIEKTVGDPKHSCEGKEECDWYINQSTKITLNCTDLGDHPVNDVILYYRDYLSGDTPPTFIAVPGGYVEVSKNEDSRHILEYYCEDALGNSNKTEQNPWVEIDVVDSQPPVSYKVVNDPKIECSQLGDTSCNYYVNQSTMIELYCNDQEPHPVGHERIYYQIWNDSTLVQDWTLYNGPFHFTEDTVHTLNWYCVDALNNTETIHTEVDKVDTTPPVTTKTVGEPSWQTGYWVSTKTPITLTATDYKEPCKIGLNCIHYEIWWDSDHNGAVDTLMKNETVCDNDTVTFHFTEESLHEIRWYAWDKLGNVETEHVQQHKVDDTPPHVVILKPVDGWYHDGGDIPGIVTLAFDDNTNPQCVSGIEDGRQCNAYLVDVLPELKIVPLDSHLKYDASMMECVGYATIPKPSGLPDGVVFLVIEVSDNVNNTKNSIQEIWDAYNQGYPDVVLDLLTSWNLPRIGIDNHPADVVIVKPEDGANITTEQQLYIEANINDGDGIVTSGIPNGKPCPVKIADINVGNIYYDDSTRKCKGTIPLPKLPDGHQPLEVSIIDNAGTTGVGITFVLVDNLPPEKDILSPVGEGYYSTVLPINVSAVDNGIGVDDSTVRFRISDDYNCLDNNPGSFNCAGSYDTGWITLNNSEKPIYKYLFDITDLEEGVKYYLKIWTCDLFASVPNYTINELKAEEFKHCVDPSLYFIIDRTPPSGPTNVIIDGNHLTWNAATDSSGINHYNIYLDGVITYTTTNTYYDVNGTGQWSVSAVDNSMPPNEGAKVPAQLKTQGNGGTTGGGTSSGGGGGFITTSATTTGTTGSTGETQPSTEGAQPPAETSGQVPGETPTTGGEEIASNPSTEVGATAFFLALSTTEWIATIVIGVIVALIIIFFLRKSHKVKKTV